MCADMRIYMCIDMCIDVSTHMCMWHVYRHVYGMCKDMYYIVYGMGTGMHNVSPVMAQQSEPTLGRVVLDRLHIGGRVL